MMTGGIYLKTRAGRSEIDTRERKLSPVLRLVLLLVDGRRTGRELARLAADLHAPADALDTLVAMGLIELAGNLADTGAAWHAGAPVDPQTLKAERFRLLYGLLSESVKQHLGLRGYFMQLKVERCADADALAALLPEVSDAIARARGEAVREQWERGVRGVLGDG